MNTLRKVDLVLLLCLLLLAAVGMMTLFAAVHSGDLSVWYKQGVYWAIGLSGMLVVCFIPLRFVGLMVWPIYLLALLALVLVPFIGDVHMGARRWLDLGIVNLQASELMKWALLLMLAYWFSTREASSLKDLSIALLCTLMPAALIVIQPDLGTALVVITAAMVVILVAGFPWKWFVGLVALSPIAAYVLWQNMHDYQKGRVLSFLSPESDPLGKGYHVIQSSIAIGSGGLFGKGYLEGSQSRLHFLPEQHTDFIFAVLAEEGGLFASAVLFMLYAVLIFRILMISLRAHTRFGGLLCVGIATIFTLYVFVNIGMVSGMLPVVGVPLPFISYGGSALLSMLLALGLVMRVSIESYDKVSWQRPGSALV
ncbi:MAG TPA: rod shape-determining protein RodA [Ghiorsea sp.]|nr:rod shape-determining protein RodA [Ghiorsea sp.]HIP08005.1 rod shape-determining protein RodA [Mariprofundaceae bacterium]